MRVLVVDDDINLRKYMRLTLQGLGCDVVEADDWLSARDQLTQVAIDGAFLDLVLQRGSGLDIAHYLQAMDLPVVFCSGVSDDFNMTQMHELGWVLTKPVRVAGLRRALEWFGKANTTH